MVHEHPNMKKAVSDITNAIQLLTTATTAPVLSAPSDVTVSPDLSVSEADGIAPVDGSVPVPIAGSCDIEVET